MNESFRVLVNVKRVQDEDTTSVEDNKHHIVLMCDKPKNVVAIWLWTKYEIYNFGKLF